MAEEAKAAHSGGGDTDGGIQPSKLPLLLGLLNTLAILAAVGTLTYTRLLFKRPKITEESERARIEKLKNQPKPTLTPGYVNFDSMTINIASTPMQPQPAAGTQTQLQGKLHYATIGFSILLADLSRKDEVDTIKPLITDQFISLAGRKQFHELTSVQGRYILKTQLIEIINGLAAKRLDPNKADPGPLVSDLYFNQFIVQ